MQEASTGSYRYRDPLQYIILTLLSQTEFKQCNFFCQTLQNEHYEAIASLLILGEASFVESNSTKKTFLHWKVKRLRCINVRVDDHSYTQLIQLASFLLKALTTVCCTEILVEMLHECLSSLQQSSTQRPVTTKVWLKYI